MAVEAAEIALMAGELGPGGEAAEGRTAAARLVERARAGDAAAFDRLVLAHQRQVLATAWRMLGREDEARDAAQEAFLRVYKHLDKFDARQDFSGWLYRIVVNVCRDLARKRGPRGRLTSYEEECAAGHLEAAPGPDDAEARAIRAQERAIIARAIATLPEKERAALVLRDLEGLPTEEVARILRSSQATVRSQISSARAKIKLYRDRHLKGGQREIKS